MNDAGDDAHREDARVRVHVRQAGRSLSARPGQTILETALQHGLEYPCGCEAGNCGSCKSYLISGTVKTLGHSPYALTAAEAACGLVLACRSIPSSDVEVAWLEIDDMPPPHPRRSLQARVVAVDRMTRDIARVRVSKAGCGDFAFSPGQFASLRFGDLPTRPYSMASQPSDSFIEFHIRKTPGGLVSAFVHEHLARDDEVSIEGPSGLSFLRDAHEGPILALAGGSGLAPIMSIVDAALMRAPSREIVLLFGVRDEPDLYYEERFLALTRQHPRFSFVPVLSQPHVARSKRRTGMLADVLEELAPALNGAKAYMAGPPAMIDSCMSKLAALGLASADCHADAFVDAPRPEEKHAAALAAPGGSR